MLVIMAGLPAAGKTTVARALASELGAVHLRLDTIEQAIVRSGAGTHPVGPVGYTVAYALAEDQLRQGWTVVADSVNPLTITRDTWHDVARAAGVDYVDVEVVCSDPAEHERRATSRTSDIPGLTPPDWQAIRQRRYEPWSGERIVIDTAGRTTEQCVSRLRGLLAERGRSGRDERPTGGAGAAAGAPPR